MRTSIALASLLTAGCVFGSGVSFAHHGWSGCDSSQSITLTGTVQSISFAFPHATVLLDADGKVWEIVLAPPSRMERRGLPDGSIRPGEQAAVEGYQHRTDPAEFRAERIQINGTSVELR